MIPKIIHTVWASNDPFKEKFYAWRKTWMEHNPDYSFMFWTPANMPLEQFSALAQLIVKGNNHYCWKSDVARYELVRIFGGIYVDTDFECLKNFDPLLNESSFAGEPWMDYCECSIFAAEKNNPIIGFTGEAVAHQIMHHPASYKSSEAIRISGECLLHCEKIYPRHYFYPDFWNKEIVAQKQVPFDKNEVYAVHHWSGFDNDGWTRDGV